MHIAITGGTGTLGQALVKRLLKGDDKRIVILSRDEQKQAIMAAEPWIDERRVRFFLGDVRDKERLIDAFWHCDTVIHAAALKRVDGISYNPTEVRKTNIQGSANVTAAAVAAGVSRVLMVSSDKAVEPANAYGVSKAAMEFEAVNSNAFAYPRGTRVSCTRYGNVLGSRGSVLHVFRQAVANGVSIPITDPRCTRFWLTVDHAVDVVLLALERMQGGEIFVPWLPAMRVMDLAEAVAPGYPTRMVGLRPGGEKLHETLLSPDEVRRTRQHLSGDVPLNQLFWVTPSYHPWREEPYRGESGPDGFVYRSDVVPNRLTVEQMRTLAAEVP